MSEMGQKGLSLNQEMQSVIPVSLGATEAQGGLGDLPTAAQQVRAREGPACVMPEPALTALPHSKPRLPDVESGSSALPHSGPQGPHQAGRLSLQEHRQLSPSVLHLRGPTPSVMECPGSPPHPYTCILRAAHKLHQPFPRPSPPWCVPRGAPHIS